MDPKNDQNINKTSLTKRHLQISTKFSKQQIEDSPQSCTAKCCIHKILNVSQVT